MRAIVLPLIIACVACGPKNVEGSLGEIVSLNYDQVQAAQTADQVAVTFVRTNGQEQDTVLQVAARLVGINSVANNPINLAETFPDGIQRGALSRNVLNDPRTTFPPLQRGQLLLNGGVVKGQSVSGSFNVTFALGTDAASGRTAFANFKASVP